MEAFAHVTSHVVSLSVGSGHHAPGFLASRSIQTSSSTDAIGLTSAISLFLCVQDTKKVACP